MDGGVPRGKVRSAGIDILLFIVTFGVYWFVWMYKAFDEVARSRGRDIRAPMWIAALAVVWVVAIGAGGIGAFQAVMKQLDEGPDQTADDPFSAMFEPPEYNALTIAGMALTALFYLFQLVYLRNAGQVVNESLASVGLPVGPNPALALTFNLLFLVGQVPIVGTFASLGGLVVAIIWVIQVQEAINRYWQPRAHGAPGPPPAGSPVSGWTPAPPPPAPPARRP